MNHQFNTPNAPSCHLAMRSDAAFPAFAEHLNRRGLGFKLPLYRAAQTQVVTLSQIGRQAMPPFEGIASTGLPSVVLIGDADGASPGPAGWAASSSLRQWASGAVIYSAGCRAKDYAGAVLLALEHRQLVLIETNPTHIAKWLSFMRSGPDPVPVLELVFRPGRAGGSQPVRPGKAAVR